MAKILVIEDDIFFGEALVKRLKIGGYEALLVRDGVSGLKELREWRPDLAFIDLTLPQMDGYAILEERQKETNIASIPIIAILNSEQVSEIKRILKLGAKDYVTRTASVLEDAVAKMRTLLPSEDKIISLLKVDDTLSGPEPAEKITPKLIGKKIMWVEDDKFLSDIIARKLATHGCALIHTMEGEEALRLVSKEKPDLVMLDILLSGLDGFEILKRIKENPLTKNIPVILLSNLGQKEDIAKGKSLHAERFLVKATVTLDEIIEEIRRVLKEHDVSLG